MAAVSFFDFDQISTQPESAMGLRQSSRGRTLTTLGESAILMALVAVGVGLAGTVALWFLGMLLANGLVWPG